MFTGGRESPAPERHDGGTSGRRTGLRGLVLRCRRSGLGQNGLAHLDHPSSGYGGLLVHQGPVNPPPVRNDAFFHRRNLLDLPNPGRIRDLRGLGLRLLQDQGLLLGLGLRREEFLRHLDQLFAGDAGLAGELPGLLNVGQGLPLDLRQGGLGRGRLELHRGQELGRVGRTLCHRILGSRSRRHGAEGKCSSGVDGTHEEDGEGQQPLQHLSSPI